MPKNIPFGEELRSELDRRQKHLKLAGTWFLDRRRLRFDRRAYDDRIVECLIDQFDFTETPNLQAQGKKRIGE